MYCLNEAEYIDAAIRSVAPGLDQLIVIDQGSTDGTREILHYLSCEFDFPVIDTHGQTFLTRGEQFFRNLEIDLCFTEWCMITDGDEILGDGWEKVVREFLDSCGDMYGAIRGNYWQMIGTSGYHTPDSPLTPEGGMRPLFFRMSDSLHAGDPMAGTKCHTSITGINPPQVANLNVDLWHMGYCKSDMTARFTRNISRGDWTALKENEDALKAGYLETARTNPVSFLPECVPVSESVKARMPASIRTPKFTCAYDVTTKRITGRFP